jgi:hypothetical protein
LIANAPFGTTLHIFSQSPISCLSSVICPDRQSRSAPLNSTGFPRRIQWTSVDGSHIQSHSLDVHRSTEVHCIHPRNHFYTTSTYIYNILFPCIYRAPQTADFSKYVVKSSEFSAAIHCLVQPYPRNFLKLCSIRLMNPLYIAGFPSNLVDVHWKSSSFSQKYTGVRGICTGFYCIP